MSFELKPDEGVGSRLREIALDEARDAESRLTHSSIVEPEAAHEVRKRIKKVRAILKLVRSEMGQRTYRRHNEAYRKVAAPLRAVRDAEVLVDTFDELCNEADPKLRPDGIDAIRSELVERVARARHDLSSRGAVEHLGLTARRADKKLRRERWSGGWSLVSAGVHDGYERARRAFHDAQEAPTLASLHELRKRLKDLKYHLELVAPSDPALIGGIVERVDRIDDLLGKDRDRAILAQHLLDVPHLPAAEEVFSWLAAPIERSRAELEHQGMGLASKLFAPSPAELVRSLALAWRTWRGAA